MSAFFVTGAGTDIGKTYVSCALLEAWRPHGHALKPIASGIDDMAASDPGRLLSAQGVGVSEERISRISPWRFKAPLAPPLAARLEGKSIEFDDAAEFCRASLRVGSGPILIEGAGGLMSPLADAHTNLDLIVALKLPVLFVSGSYLGAVSHTLTALECLNMRSIPIAAVIVSESEISAGLGDTCAMLRAFAPGLAIVPAPRDDASWAKPLSEKLLRA